MSRSSSVARQFALGALLTLSAGVGAQEETAESRAEKVRNALIDRAMSSPAHVSSSAWLDESGQLRHVTRIYSELRARATADFAESETPKSSESAGKSLGGTVSTTASKSGQAAASASAAFPPPEHSKSVASSDEPACHTPSRGLRRVAALQVQAHPWDGARGYAVVAEFELILRRAMAQLASSGDFAIAPTEGRTLGSYERLLTRQDLHSVPYQIEASIAPVVMSASMAESLGAADDRGADSSATIPMGAVRRAVFDDTRVFPTWPWQRDTTLAGQHFEVSLGLREVATGRTVSQQRIPIYLPARPSVVGSSEIPDAVRNALQAATIAWWSQVRSAVVCDALQVVAQGDLGTGQVFIPLGAAAGVRVGDRWVLEDRARVPGRVLEEGALERARVAEVISVASHRAVLKLTQHEQAAAIPAERGVPWFATPM